jgi:branched-subunit amino acid transport protein
MSDLLLILAMGAITYGSRAVFLANPGTPPSGLVRRFLLRFPLALFVALAVSILVVPEGDVDARLGWAAIGGAALGGWVAKRALYGVVGVGFAGYWVGRWLTG